MNLERLEDRSLLAATITVNSTLDTVAPDNFLTLREAIEINNRTLDVATLSSGEQQLIAGAPTSSDADTIVFNIPGSGVQMIQPLSALPIITDPVLIDGYSQSGAHPNDALAGDNAVLLIELNGNLAGNADGLTIDAGSSTLRGLVIDHFHGNGVVLRTNGFNAITGNFIGVNAAGTGAAANLQAGVLVSGSPNNVVGGTTPDARNIISGNLTSGIEVNGSSSGTQIQGNFIGTDVTGSSGPSNGKTGVLISFGQSILVGGAAAGAGNTIAFNPGGGVAVSAGIANRILANSIFANGGLGIDLGNDGITPNDVGDGDNGPNNLQNFPQLASASVTGNTVAVSYAVPSSTTSSAYPIRIEFFKADAGGPQGRLLLGLDAYSANDAGTTKTAVLTLPAGTTLSPGDRLVATATDSKNNTSEFSAAISVATPQQLHTPSITNSSTTQNTQTTSGLVISRNPADGPEVTHFQITSITGGTLFQNDGITPIKDGDFITAGQGSKGLKFTPAPNFVGTATFNVQSSLNNTSTGLGGGIATANITVSAPTVGFDFGDAPDKYHTLLASNGARHALGSGLFLGKSVSAEADATPSASAASDSGDDGVTLPTRLVAGLDAVATVVASAPGRLDAWIDFNRNGTFDAAEQIASGLPVTAGANTIKFSVPLSAASGTTYARFRLSTAGGLAATGAAPDGEVEDYAIPIVVPAAGTAILIDDPAAPGKKVLVARGTTQTDHIQIQLKSTVVLCKNGCKIAVYTASSVGRVVVLGLDGSDTVQVDPKLKVPVQVQRRHRP